MQVNNLQEFFVQWHLTEKCNLRCSHCYQTGGKFAELSLTEIREVLDEIVDMLAAWSTAYQVEFAPSFNVTGGEPLLRPDLLDILDDMKDRGFASYLLTNGTLIDAPKAVALAECGVKGIQVSIEGPEEIHDRIRGQGSFQASCQGVAHLLAAGHQVTLNATLSELNADKFHDLVDIATLLGVQRLGFSRLVPSGRGLGLVDQMIGPDKLQDIYKAIFALTTPGLQIVTGDPVASQLRYGAGMDDGGSIATGGCAAGIAGLTLLPDGTVTPCRRLAVPIGNVRHDSLREIWADSTVLAQLRDRQQYKGRCGSCANWADCRGCRAIAYAHSLAHGRDDLMAEDPQCFLNCS